MRKVSASKSLSQIEEASAASPPAAPSAKPAVRESMSAPTEVAPITEKMQVGSEVLLGNDHAHDGSKGKILSEHKLGGYVVRTDNMKDGKPVDTRASEKHFVNPEPAATNADNAVETVSSANGTPPAVNNGKKERRRLSSLEKLLEECR